MDLSAFLLVSVSILVVAVPPLVIDWWRHRYVRRGWISEREHARWAAWWDDHAVHSPWEARLPDPAHDWWVDPSDTA